MALCGRGVISGTIPENCLKGLRKIRKASGGMDDLQNKI